MTTNETRVQRAETVLQAYVEARGEAYVGSSSEITDLIADLLHLSVCLDEGEDAVESTLRLARMHFDAEHGNPEEEAAYSREQIAVIAEQIALDETVSKGDAEKRTANVHASYDAPK